VSLELDGLKFPSQFNLNVFQTSSNFPA